MQILFKIKPENTTFWVFFGSKYLYKLSRFQEIERYFTNIKNCCYHNILKSRLLNPNAYPSFDKFEMTKNMVFSGLIFNEICILF